MSKDGKDDIEDTRAHFKDTFTGYSRTTARNELADSIVGGRTDAAIGWTAELLCSGFLREIWDVILVILCQNIYLANPKLPVYIETRYNYFRSLMRSHSNDLCARNDMKVREVMTEIIYILCVSKKRPKLHIIKLPDDAFDAKHMALTAPSIKYARSVFRKNDPQEIFAATNELVYCLSERDALKSCYWLEWILVLEAQKRKRKDVFRCATRSLPPTVNDKFAGDASWLIWDIIKKEADERIQPLIAKIVNALYNLFSSRYGPSTSRKLRCVYYHCCHLLAEPIDVDTPILADSRSLQDVVKRTNTVYRQLKKTQKNDIGYLSKII